MVETSSVPPYKRGFRVRSLNPVHSGLPGGFVQKFISRSQKLHIFDQKFIFPNFCLQYFYFFIFFTKLMFLLINKIFYFLSLILLPFCLPIVAPPIQGLRCSRLVVRSHAQEPHPTPPPSRRRALGRPDDTHKWAEPLVY